MLFSYNILKKIARLDESVTVDQMVQAINSIGFEVEEYNKFVDVEGIKFGRVLKTIPNPNSDKLTVCRIEFDDCERTIQTAATNVRVGKIVVAFVPGSRVGKMTFDTKELKGIISEGMLSSPVEFGINDDLVRDENKSGIAFYDIDDLSLDPVEVLGLNDFIIDVTILSNRSDANSYFIMAKEIASYFGTTVVLPTIQEGQYESELIVKNGESKSLVMLEALDDFTISMQEQIFLAKHGVKSINNIVDLTNLTLLMTGQPTHAYDRSKVGNTFRATKYSGNVKVFGNKDVELYDDLVIESDGKPVSVAGVIGFENTGVTNNTREFVIELGRFNIKDVRKAVKSVKLNTSASNQSVKEIALGTTELAIAYITTKINSFSDPVNFVMPKPKQVKFDEKVLALLSGMDIIGDPRYAKTKKALVNLGFDFEDGHVIVPQYRHDIDHQQDMNEEVFRFFGYDNFKLQAPKMTPFKVTSSRSIHKEVASAGYQGVITYTLISKELNKVNPFNFKETIALETFVSKEREVIRNSQAMSLLQVIEYNQKRKIEDISIFDFGTINNGYKTLAMASTIKSFEEMKQDLCNIIASDLRFERHTSKDLHPGVSAVVIYKDKPIGWIGKVHPSLTSIDAFIAEVAVPKSITSKTFEEYSNDPMKSRDITFALKAKEEIQIKIDELKSVAQVFDVKVIDLFIKDSINKVTIRIIAPEESITIIDKKYNVE